MSEAEVGTRLSSEEREDSKVSQEREEQDSKMDLEKEEPKEEEKNSKLVEDKYSKTVEDRHSKRKRYSRSRSRSRDEDRDRRDRDYRRDRDDRRRDDRDRDYRRDRDDRRRDDRDRDYRRDRDDRRRDDRDYRRDREDRDRDYRRDRDDRKEDKRREEKKEEKTETNEVEFRKPLETGKAGGVYIPPFKLAMMQKDVKDKSSLEYQKMTWEALKKSINGLINKVSINNIGNLIPEIFYENLIRGRGIFVRSMMKAQSASPNFTNVYAALAAVVNTKFPEIGELLVKRLIVTFRKGFRRNHKLSCLTSTQFLAHLANQNMLGIIIPLQIAALLLEKPTDDSVEVACMFLTECGASLQEQSPAALNGVFDRFRSILHEGEIDKRVQYIIEQLFAVRKSNFVENPPIRSELDLVEAEDQIVHEDFSLDDEFDVEDRLNFFHFDEEFAENEEKYTILRKEILGEETVDELEGKESNGPPDEEPSDQEEEGNQEGSGATEAIQDNTETDLVNLRRTIYLTIMSSVDFNECAHKLLKMKLKPGQEMEVCNMIIECCSQERTFMRFYGLLGQRFCMLDKLYQEAFDRSFAEHYSTIHRLETNKLRNVSKFFAHLIHTDALPWSAFEYIRLTEDDTTASSRIFIKILMQELTENLGLQKLNARFNDEYLKPHFEGLFPKDHPKNTRFAINFFTAIGLGGLTDDLREHLKTAPKPIEPASESESSSSESSSSESSSESESSSSESSESSESSSSESSGSSRDRRKRRRH